LQVHARKYGLPIDRLSFKYHVLPTYRDQQLIADATAKLQYGEELEQDKALASPNDGILVHGLFMDGFRWDDDNMVLTDSLAGVMNSALPVMHMEPKMDYEAPSEDYRAPLYKTSARAGTLSTTGQFV
jgi:dynein heavy chain, axonemal